MPVEPLDGDHIRCVIEAALLAADDALTLDRLFKLFAAGELAEEGARNQIRDALAELTAACEGRGFELKKVASGYRMQVRQDFSPWVSRLWDEKPPRYTRALLETMALIAYKQPATRGDIEEVRGVTVSSNIMRTLLERGWIREVGQRDVPGRPSMYGTTKEFLDYFNLSTLDELPSLPEIRELIEPAAAAADTELDAGEETRSEATRALLEQDPEGQVEAEAEAEAEQEAEAKGSDAETEDSAPDSSDSATDSKSDSATDESTDSSANNAIDESTDTSTDTQTNASAESPIFESDEVLVVSESAEVEVQAEVKSDANLDTLPVAQTKE